MTKALKLPRAKHNTLDELGAYASGVNKAKARNASGWSPTASTLDTPVKLKGGSKCERCELHRNRRTVCVPGRGSKKAKYVFVGAAPDFQEDKTGRAFVGTAAQLLDTLMDDAGFKPSETFLTYVAKCSPPTKREPKQAEIVECLPWFDKELSALPADAVIVPVGSVALRVLTGKRGIMKWAGIKLEHEGRTFFPILHPSQVLASPRKLSALRSQLRSLKGLDKPSKLLYAWQKVSAFDLRKKIERTAKKQNSSTLVIDFETTSKNPHEAEAVCGAFYMPGWPKVLVADARKDKRAFRTLVRSAIKHTKWVCQNWKYEAICAKQWVGQWPRLSFDTMLAHSLLDENASHALSDLCSLVGMDGYDSELRAHLATGGEHHDAPPKLLYKYNAGDVWATWLLAKLFRKHLKKDPALYKFYRKHTERTAQALARIEWTGLYVDTKAATRIAKGFRTEMESLQAKAEKRGVNLASTKDVNRHTFEELGYPILETTKTGKPSMGKDAIEQLQERYPKSGFLKALSRYRSLKTWCTNFVEKHPLRVDSNSILHGSFNVHVAVTGRLSSSDPNLQNIPREKAVKEIFASRFKGGRIVQADYSQLELRVLAAMSGDERMLKAFREGEDIHRNTGAFISGSKPEDVTKEERFNGKTVNFGVVYGLGPPGLAKQAKLTVQKARTYLRRWFTYHHGVRNLLRDWRQLTVSQGFLRSPVFARIRHLPWAKVAGTEKRALRQACNFPVQHAASELMCAVIAHLVLDTGPDTFAGLGLEARVVATVHDSIYVDCPKREAKTVARLIKTVMEEWAPKQFPWIQSVPLIADVEIGKTMGG